MRCQSCGCFALRTFCSDCTRILSQHSLGFRDDAEFKVYYFYKYSDIKHIIHTKHHLHGLFTLKALANLSFSKFAKEFKFGEKILAIPLDDSINSGYSHTAILANSLKSKDIKPSFNTIKAMSNVKYSGQSLSYRKKHKRNFKLLKKVDRPVILVDDLITTGLTMKEAFDVCQKAGISVLFGLTLADAKP